MSSRSGVDVGCTGVCPYRTTEMLASNRALAQIERALIFPPINVQVGTRRHTSAFARKRELNQILRISMDGASPWGGGCTRCSRITLRGANSNESCDSGAVTAANASD